MTEIINYRRILPYSILLAVIGSAFILLCRPMRVSAARYHESVEQTADSTDSIDSTRPALEEMTDYKELSSYIADRWEEDYFDHMTVDMDSGQIIKDGEKEIFAEEFNITNQEAQDIIQSEDNIEEFLERSEPDTIYQVEETGDGDVVITAPYQTKRLIIDQLVEDNIYSASEICFNTLDHETILQFATEEETKQAYEKASKLYGKSHCYVDEIIYEGGLFQSTDSKELPKPAVCWSWGTAFMKMNYLKSQTGYYGLGNRVKVAVIDSGVDQSHPLFAGGRISGQSWNFVSGNKNLKDDFGHGSHVSGIIADSTPSNVSILMLKVTNSKGQASMYAIKNALRYAVRKKVQVINLSMVTENKYAGRIKYLNDVIRKAYYRGIPICAASGNKGIDARYSYPANVKQVITVGAINMNGSRANVTDSRTGKRIYYSNYGSSVDFAAPGTDIVSAGKGGNYYYMTGTSMAAPHVTAAVAYLKMMQPNLSVQGVEKQLRSMSVDLGAKGKDPYFGWGCPSLGKLFEKGISYKTYIVKPIVGKAKILSVSNEKRGIKITWKKVPKADKYKIYRKKANGKYKRIATVSAKKRFYIDRKVSEGNKYTYSVRACRDGEEGNKSEDQMTVCVKMVSGLKSVRVSKSSFTVQWKKKKKISGYQIRYSSSRRTGKSKIITLKKSKQQITGLKNTCCYYQVRAYKTNGKRTYYSAWTSKNRVRMR